MILGLFRGKEIADMDREELLEFARWAVGRLQELQIIEQETQDYRINKEIQNDD